MKQFTYVMFCLFYLILYIAHKKMKKLTLIISFLFVLFNLNAQNALIETYTHKPSTNSTKAITDVLYWADAVIGTDQLLSALASSTYTYDIASSAADYATKIATGNYELGILFIQTSASSGYATAINALGAFVAGGGKSMYFDWSRNNTYSPYFEFTYTGGTNQTSVDIIEPTMAGSTNPMTLTNTGWGTYATDLIPTGTATIAANFPSNNAIVIGNNGRSINFGYANDLTPNNEVFGLALDYLLAIRNGLNLDGINDYVEMGNVLNMTNPFTIECWVNANNYTGFKTLLAKKPNVFSANGYSINIINGAVQFQTNGANITTVNDLVPNLTWTHIAFVDDGTTQKIYVNGSEAALVSTAYNLISSTNSLNIGRYDGGGFPFEGELDELRFWSTARTECEIYSDMNTELIGNEAFLTAYYNFNVGDPAGVNAGLTSLPDLTINNYAGTLNNFALTGTSSNWIVSGFVVSGINEDETDPVITSTHDDTIVSANSNCESIVADYTSFVTATDNCDINLDITQSPIAGSIISGSTNIITLIATDDDLNQADTTFNISVVDDSIPIIPILANVTGECFAIAVTPTTTDACAGTIIGTTSDPLTYTIEGTYTITWNFDDGNGNDIDVIQDVVIDDVTFPVEDSAILADLTDDCSVNILTAPTATDNCAGSIIGTTTTVFPVTNQGTTVVTWTYDDGNGNIVTQNQNIIINDTILPVEDVAILADLTDECSVYMPIAPTATDNCAGSIMGTTTTVFPITNQGTTVITWTYDDGKGNVVTQNQNIIINDTTAPTFYCPTNMYICENTIDISPMYVLDNCDTVTISYELSGATIATGVDDASSEIFNTGVTDVLYIYNDVNGNIDSCSFMVTYLIPDNSVTVGSFTLTANGIGTYQWYNCDTETIVSGETNQSFTPTISGNYSLIISNIVCTDTSDCHYVVGTGINNSGTNTATKVFPNPASDIVTIIPGTNQNINLSIYNMTGSMVYFKENINSESIVLNIENYSRGIYLIKLASENNFEVIKLIKR
jgi:Concanavalin A-like lectin/glucanases superfamily/Secretion system C-terminal sorting domain/HYR domain